MAKIKTRQYRRTTRHLRIRKKLKGSSERPRVIIFRSLKHIYAQIIDDEKGCTLVSASTHDAEIKSKMKSKTLKNVGFAKMVGLLLAERALAKKIKKVMFDRAGYLYHGRVKALADAAREGGLEF